MAANENYKKQFEDFLDEQKKRWATYTKEQRDYLKRRKDEDKLKSASVNNRYGAGFSALGITDAEVEQALYMDVHSFIDQALGDAKSKKSGNFESLLTKAHREWAYIDTLQKVSVRINLDDGKYPSVTVLNQNSKTTQHRTVSPEDWTELYEQTNKAMGRPGGGYSKADEFYLSEMKDYVHDPKFLAKQKEMWEARAKEAEEERKKREERAAIESQYSDAKIAAEDERKLMAQLVAKHEFSILLQNKNQRPNEWSPDYLNRKHPDQTDYYTQFAKGVVAVNQGYRTPYFEDYEKLAEKNLNLKPRSAMNSIEEIQASTYVEEYNAFQLAVRANYYEEKYTNITGRSEELYQYKQKLAAKGQQLPNLANSNGLAELNAPVDNSRLFVPSYVIQPVQAGDNKGRFKFHAVQDFDNNADKARGIPDKRTRKGNNLNESFLPVYRGANFPPKRAYVVEGVSTAISAAALLDLENHPEKDDIWVVSSFDAGNLIKVVKSLHENLGNNTEVVALLDNDKKIKKDPHGRPIRDVNGELIEDLLAHNAGKAALEKINEYIEDIETLPICKFHNPDGSAFFNIVPKNIACVTTPIEYVDILKKESDVNDFDVNLIKSGVPLDKRKELFQASYLSKVQAFKDERHNTILTKLDNNPDLMDVALSRLQQAESTYLQSLSAVAAGEQVQNYVEQTKQAPESAVQSAQVNNQNKQHPQPAIEQIQPQPQQSQPQQQQQQTPRRPMP